MQTTLLVWLAVASIIAIIIASSSIRKLINLRAAHRAVNNGDNSSASLVNNSASSAGNSVSSAGKHAFLHKLISIGSEREEIWVPGDIMPWNNKDDK